MTVSVLFLLGRFLLAVPFVMVGMDRALSDQAPRGERLWSAVGVLAAAGVVLGVYGDAAALVLGVATVGIGVIECQRPGTDDATRLRFVGLLGAAIATAACVAAVGTAIDLTFTDPLLDLDLR